MFYFSRPPTKPSLFITLFLENHRDINCYVCFCQWFHDQKISTEKFSTKKIFDQKILDRWPSWAVTIGYFTRRWIRFEWNRSKRLFVTTLGRNWMTHNATWVIYMTHFQSSLRFSVFSLQFLDGLPKWTTEHITNQYYIYKGPIDKLVTYLVIK